MRKRRGIGTVITTLIILIASVVLGAGVIFFGGSMFQTNTQNESIQVSNTHIWVSPSGTSSIAAFAVHNTGGKVVAIQSVMIRGMEVPFTSWYYNNSASVANAANIQRAFVADFTPIAVNVDGLAGEEQFTQATGAISLAQGQAVIIYVSDPAGIDAIDSGQAFNLTVHAGRASSSVASVSVTTS
jgi:hypothetical protein